MIKNKLKILTVFTFLFFALSLNAQINLPSNLPTSSDYLQVKINPENPGPNEKVSINLEFYISDLKKSEISWTLNGELQKKDFGATSFEFFTGQVGESQRISISVITFEGERLTKEIVLRPADVDLVWNANTYIPPFYKGRALLTGRGGELEVTAIPNFIDTNGSKINPQFLNYKWYKNNTFLIDQSGYGKTSIKIKRASIPRPFGIRVIVETIDGLISAEKTVQINYEDPSVLVYEKHPLYGIMFNQAVNEIELENQEITLSAIPYFFSEVFKNNGLIEYTWRQNGQNLPQSSNQNTMIFRQTEDGQSGKVNIEISVQNKNDFIQTSTRDVEITLSE